MAKGNMLLGYSRGSVGDVTFSRVKGQQVQRARNRNPLNPKTPSQMWQRAKLASALNMYKLTRSGVYDFAFEDRTSRESDYNAYMRHNIARIVPLRKSSASAGMMPPASVIMSVGSLDSIDIEVDDNGDGYIMGADLVDTSLEASDIPSSGTLTVAGLYDILHRVYGMQEGDVVSVICYYVKEVDYSDTNPWVAVNGSQLVCQTSQEVLSATDTDAVSDAFNITKDAAPGDVAMIVAPTLSDYVCAGIAVIWSRPSSDGLRVSTSELHICNTFKSIYTAISDGGESYDEYRESVLQSWSASDVAYLAGGGD